MRSPLPCSYFVSLPDISWYCLISEHASGNVSPCGPLCHRWSITTGVGLLLAEAHGSPWSSQISGKCQLSALIGSVMYSGPFASFMPPKPRKVRCRQVCLMCVCADLLSQHFPARILTQNWLSYTTLRQLFCLTKALAALPCVPTVRVCQIN